MRNPIIVYPEAPEVREVLAKMLEEAVKDEDAEAILKSFHDAFEKNYLRIKAYLHEKEMKNNET